MFTAPDGPDAQLAGDVFAAIQDREWERLAQLTDPDVAVEVHAVAGIRTTRNEHVWRSRSMRGRDELMAYLRELQLAAPALAVTAVASSRSQGGAVVRAECAGVDQEGSPFDAITDFSVWSQDGLVRRLEAHITELAVGTEVIRRGEGDPRRYFKTFLD